MKVIQRSIKKLDFFGPQINFTIKREASFKSVLGGFISLIVYCLYIFFFILFGRDMLYRLNPNVTLETQLPESQQSYQISNETFIAWRLENFKGEPIDIVNLLNVYLLYLSYDNEQSTIKDFNSLSISNCQDEKFKYFFNNTFYKSEEWFCLDFSQIEGKNLTGSFSDESISYVSFVMDICELDFEKNTKSNCKNFREMRKIFAENELVFAVLYHDTVFRANNYQAPLQKQFKKNLNAMNINQLKLEMLYYQNTLVEQDAGILFDDQRELTNMTTINRREEITNFKSDEILDEYYKTDEFRVSNSIHNLLFLYDQPYKRYIRKYMKLQDVFGNVNGFMDFLILILNITSFYYNYKFDYFLFEKIVKVKIEKGLLSNAKRDNVLNQKMYNAIAENKDIKGKNNITNIDLDNVYHTINEINDKKANNQKENFSPSKKLDSNFNEDLKNPTQIVNQKNKKVNENSSLLIKQQNRNMKSEDAIISSISVSAASFDSPKTGTSKIITKPANLVINNFVNNEREYGVIETGLTEADRNLIIEKLKSLSSNPIHKKRYLEKNIFLYYCKSKNKRKAFDLKLLETYIDKINEKFDVFYYLNVNRQFKNLKKFIFKEKNDSTIFKLLASNVYDITISDYNGDYFNKEKKLKIIIEEWVNNLKHINDGDLSHFIFEAIKE